MPSINARRTIAGTLFALVLLAGCGVPTAATSVLDEPAMPGATPEQPVATSEATPRPTHNPAPEPTPQPRSITYSTPYSDGLTFYENPSEGFAIVLPDRWLHVQMDQEVLEERIAALAEQQPLLMAFARQAFRNLADSGVKFYAADLRHSADTQTCSCAAIVYITRKDNGAQVALEALAPQTIEEAQELVGQGDSVMHQRLQLPAGEALEVAYHMKQQIGITAKSFIVTQYVLVNGSDIYTVTFTTTPDLVAEYAPIFDEIRNSFRLIERRA